MSGGLKIYCSPSRLYKPFVLKRTFYTSNWSTRCETFGHSHCAAYATMIRDGIRWSVRWVFNWLPCVFLRLADKTTSYPVSQATHGEKCCIRADRAGSRNRCSWSALSIAHQPVARKRFWARFSFRKFESMVQQNSTPPCHWRISCPEVPLIIAGIPEFGSARNPISWIMVLYKRFLYSIFIIKSCPSQGKWSSSRSWTLISIGAKYQTTSRSRRAHIAQRCRTVWTYGSFVQSSRSSFGQVRLSTVLLHIWSRRQRECHPRDPPIVQKCSVSPWTRRKSMFRHWHWSLSD